VGSLARHCTGLLLIVAAAGGVAACHTTPRGQAESASVFTPARRTTGAAVRDFFGVRPKAVQPVAFPHDVHIEKGLACTEYCHESVTKGPIAGLPSVKTCLICHAAIATDRPIIQTITELESKGVDLAWQRVYGYAPEAHVRFNHAPHIRAGVECSTCHGNVGRQKVAERVVDLNMGFCVNCHKSKNASNDCLTCHF
jgi:Cytochrome c7 and related cytochrome c